MEQMVSTNAEIERIAAQLMANHCNNEATASRHPVKSVILQLIKQLQWVLFPGYFAEYSESGRDQRYSMKYRLHSLLDEISSELAEQIGLALQFCPSEAAKLTASEISLQFLSILPAVRESLETDIEAAYQGDPAAFSQSEIIISYPGFYAVMIYRLAHELHLLSVPLIPRIMTEHAHNVTGIDIHPGATIGKHFFMDHGTGIVIGETTVIGNHVKIYQGVTLGALSTSGGQKLKNAKRHPTICDHVTIYSGASILGGETVIGEHSVIGGNAFVITSIPAKTKVSIKNPELRYKNGSSSSQDDQDLTEYWFYRI
jgi:serine O-acetyltransferase